MLYSASFDGTVRVWRGDETEWEAAATVDFGGQTVWDVKPLDGGEKVVCCGAGGLLAVVDGATQTVLCRLEDPSLRDVYSVAVHHRRIAVGCGDNSIRLFSFVWAACD